MVHLQHLNVKDHQESSNILDLNVKDHQESSNILFERQGPSGVK